MPVPDPPPPTTLQQIVPIASAVASVIAAAVAWKQAERTIRLKAESDLQLERLRLEAARRQKAFEAARAASEPVAAALSDAWNEMQSLKDVISRTLSPSRFDLEVALTRTRESAARLGAGYGRCGADLDEMARRAWHAAKNTADGLEAVLARHDEARQASEADLAVIQRRLRDIRALLTDYQAQLARARQTLADTYTHRILVAL
jgi:predicted  nucleic acid-binding Zn-ribbon protein